jgi:hypothetical protein
MVLFSMLFIDQMHERLNRFRHILSGGIGISQYSQKLALNRKNERTGADEWFDPDLRDVR